MDLTALFSPLLEQGPATYFVFRPADGRVLFVSSAYERVLGGCVATVDEELPSWIARLHPDDRLYLRDRLSSATAGHFVEDVLVRITSPDGPTRWLNLEAAGESVESTATGELTSEVVISGSVRDVTSQQRVLETANRFQLKKNALLEILSHEMASPLVLTEQLSEYIAERVQVLNDPQLNSMIADARRLCQEGLDLIRTFVDQEFLESSNVDVVVKRVDLAAKLREMISTFQRRQAGGQQFLFEGSHPSVYVHLDEHKFMQVISNLIGNSIKFTPDGGVIRLSIHQQPDQVVVTVADTGIGIPEHQLPGLFERFTRARRVGLRGERTTGLGMSICKTIVEWHHGQITVESTEGVGTTFTIRLPRTIESTNADS